jgi:hypothetical protein
MLYSDIFLFTFISTTYIIKFSIYLCSKFFFCLNPHDSPELTQISEGLL